MGLNAFWISSQDISLKEAVGYFSVLPVTEPILTVALHYKLVVKLVLAVLNW